MELCMASNGYRRKVLVLSEESTISNLLLLVKELGCEHAVDSYGEPVLASLTPRQIDSAIVDLRCPNSNFRANGVREIWPSLVGRVLVINVEVYSPKTMQMVEQCLLRETSLGLLLGGLTNRLRALLRLGPSPNQNLIPTAQRK